MQGTENAGLFLPSLEYGLYLGLGISLIDGILTAWVGFNAGNLEWLGSLTGILLLIYFVKLYRDKERGGTLDYGQGLGFGALTGLFGAIVFGLYTYLYLAFNEQVIQDILVKVEKTLQKEGIEGEKLDSTMELYSKFMTPFSYAATSVLFYAFFHFLLSLIAAAILKRSTYHG